MTALQRSALKAETFKVAQCMADSAFEAPTYACDTHSLQRASDLTPLQAVLNLLTNLCKFVRTCKNFERMCPCNFQVCMMPLERPRGIGTSIVSQAGVTENTAIHVGISSGLQSTAYLSDIAD